VAGGIEDLFRAHWSLVLGYLARRTGSASLAEELAQETFYRATRAFLGWRGGAPAAWLLAIARNVLIDEARRGQRLVPLSETLFESGGLTVETSERVSEALARPPATQRRLLELVYVDGYTHAEVAAMTGTMAGAIRTAVWRAHQAFQQLYLPYCALLAISANIRALLRSSR
jgi:RNA polymerase sigma factor (sigma-70 family)